MRTRNLIVSLASPLLPPLQVSVPNNTALISNIGSTSPIFSAAALFRTMMASSGKAGRARLFFENEPRVDRRPRFFPAWFICFPWYSSHYRMCSQPGKLADAFIDCFIQLKIISTIRCPGPLTDSPLSQAYDFLNA